MSDKSAKALRETEKKNKAANAKGPKSELYSGKGKAKGGLKAPKKKPKKVKEG